MAIDWLKVPSNVQGGGYETIDFNFDAGYMDVYVLSNNDNLIAEVNLPQAADPVKTITMEKVELGSDSIIILDADGTINGLYVYKIRLVSAADVEAVMAVLNGWVDSGLALVGIDSNEAAQTTQETETASAE